LTKEALKLALEALTNAIAVRHGEGGTKFVNPLEPNAITAIKEAMAQDEQELDEAAIRADEREACANIDFYEILREICSKAQAQEYSNYVETAIRARGNT
jgi:hypothetical protein